MIIEHTARPRQRRYRELFLISFVAIILIATTMVNQTIHLFFSDIAQPFFSSFSHVSKTLSTTMTTLSTLPNLTKENSILQKENQILKQKLLMMESSQRENARLKDLLAIPFAPDYQAVSAYVIARSPDHWFDRLVLNVGNDKGIRQNNAVINQFGLVGKVIEVSNTTALVQLLADPESAVSCLTEHGRFPAIVTGSHHEMAKLKYLQNYSEVKS